MDDGRVALTSPVVDENLPFPFVYYPNHYGTFMAFSRSRKQKPVMCSCSEPAILNYLRLRRADLPLNSNPLRMAPLDSFNFPDSIVAASLEEKADPLRAIHFELKICHRCNIATPRLRYCHPMYGGEFKQAFGWYINQSLFRSGVDRWFSNCLPDVCPPDIQQLVNKLNEDTAKRGEVAKSFQENPNESTRMDLQRLEEAIPKQKRKIWNIFENETRREFGIRRIGEAWVSENILYQIVTRLFSESECLRHSRPPWLEGMELDIYIQSKKIAFEYQGQQHFHPVDHWGGREALEELKRRDARKAELCRLHGVLLIPIEYTEPLTEEHIRVRVCMEAPNNRLQSDGLQPTASGHR